MAACNPASIVNALFNLFVGLKPDLQSSIRHVMPACRSGFSPTNPPHPPHRQRGFTLMELVISILVLGILGATAAYGIQNGVIAFQATQEAVDSLGKLRYASERLARELRAIRRDPLDSARYDIATLDPDAIDFTRQDGTVVRVAVSGGALTLEYVGLAGPQILTDQLAGFTLAYHDRDGNSTGSATAVAFIDLQLTLVDGAGTLVHRGCVALRGQP